MVVNRNVMEGLIIREKFKDYFNSDLKFRRNQTQKCLSYFLHYTVKKDLNTCMYVNLFTYLKVQFFADNLPRILLG